MKKKYYHVLFLATGGLFMLSSYAFRYEPTVAAAEPVAVVEAAPVAEETATRVDVAAIAIPDVQFDFDKATIRPESYPELDRVAQLMAENNASLKLGGHADNVGEYVYNWHLSKARAEAVKTYLTANGANEAKIAATEHGDTTPKASNDTEEGRQQNRRVEMALF